MRFRFAFREFRSASGGRLTPRPIVDLWVHGIEDASFAALADTGAVRTCLSADLAEDVGIAPNRAAAEEFALGGVTVTGQPARATLSLKSTQGEHTWDAPVWFCDPWPFDFQLLGLDGFFRHFWVTIAAYEEWLECEPYGHPT